MKALIIDEPWIGKILRGEKKWEMRKTACHLRGPFALIRKGSGAVVGTAEMIDSLRPIGSREAYAEAECNHGISPERQEKAYADGWTTPWVLAHACALPRPVTYSHPFGAVVWVNLTPDVVAAIKAQSGTSGLSSMPDDPVPTGQAVSRTSKAADPVEPPVIRRPPAVVSGGDDVRTVVVTGGNIRNHHIYLPLDFFPADAIGGSNKAEAASRPVSVTFRPGLTCETDIDRTKRIFRARGPVNDFLTRAGVDEGDTLLITRHSEYAYTIVKASNV